MEDGSLKTAKKIIGLTGGIGSGKSTVAKFIEELGYPVYNSDHEGIYACWYIFFGK